MPQVAEAVQLKIKVAAEPALEARQLAEMVVAGVAEIQLQPQEV